MNSCVLGFNGERLDPVSGTTHLGNGYRAYNPVLMRFDCPDSWSPFGEGGINPYVYCAGDPVNHADPSGHHSFWGWLSIGVGVVLGVLLTPVSGGSSLAVALSAVSVSTAVLSTGLAVAQHFVEESNPKAAAALGWAALGTGIVSGLSSAALTRVAPGVKSLVSLLEGSSNRPIGGLMISGGNVSEGTGSVNWTERIHLKANTTLYQAPAKPSRVWFLNQLEDATRYEIINSVDTDMRLKPMGLYIFVNRVDEPDVVRLARFGRVSGHTSLTQAVGTNAYQPKDVFFAGEIKFDMGGKLNSWSGASGHYMGNIETSSGKFIPRDLPENLHITNLSDRVKKMLPSDKYSLSNVEGRYLEII